MIKQIKHIIELIYNYRGGGFVVMIIILVYCGISGCGQYKAMVSGKDYLGVGVYRGYVEEDEGRRRVSCLSGVGILFFEHTLHVGYAEINMVKANSGVAIERMILPGMEIATGRYAEEWAQEIIDTNGK